MRLSTYIVAIAAILAPSTARAQLYDAWDFTARALTQKWFVDSLAASDVRLVSIEQFNRNGFVLDSGKSTHWSYLYYSPSTRKVGVAIMYLNAQKLWRLHRWNRWDLGSDTTRHTPLDTPSGDYSSRALALALTSDAGYMRFRAEHPTVLNPSVVLRKRRAAEDYDPRSALPDNANLWVVTHDPHGDSITVCYYVPATAQLQCSTYFSHDALPVARISTKSSIQFGMSNDGRFGVDLYKRAGWFIVKEMGPTAHMMFGAGIWFGARKRVDGELVPRVMITYDPSSGESWATPGELLTPRAEHARSIMHASSQHDSITGAPIAPEALRWPLWLPWPARTPSMMNPGRYVMMDADRTSGGPWWVKPAFVPDVEEQFVARYHDGNVNRLEDTLRTGYPLGLQVQENIYAGPAGLKSTVIVQYQIVNTSRDTLFDAAIGAVCDFELNGNLTRHYYERPDLRTAIAHSGVKLGMTLLEGPMTRADGTIDNTRRHAYRTEGRLGGYNSWKLSKDPRYTMRMYDTLTNGEFDSVSVVADLRGLLSTEKFTMLPGDTAYYAIAYTAHWKIQPTFDELLEAAMDAYYFEAPAGVDDGATVGEFDLVVSPNPATDRIGIRVSGFDHAPIDVRLFDAIGRLRHTQRLAPATTAHDIDARRLESGSYTVVVRSGSQSQVALVVVAK